jgi:flagellar hook-associated protein 3 FlgL
MRIADKMQYNQVTKNISKNRTDMSDLQNQAATQKRVNKPSDDPLAAAKVLSARTEERGNAQFVKNINNAKSFLEFSDQSLGELGDMLVRAKELAISQSSDASANEQTRQVTSQEISQIFNQAVNVGNRKLGDRYIFGGFKTQTTPFDKNGQYFGDDGDMKLQTNKDAFIAMNIPGNKIFLGEGFHAEGTLRPGTETPKTPAELNDVREKEGEYYRLRQEENENTVQMRGPSSVYSDEKISSKDPVTQRTGVNVFEVLKGLEISLKTNDKEGVQQAMDYLDQSINQVIQSRAEVGSRIMAVNSLTESLQKAIVDNKATASQLEDVDAFQLVSDINKTDSALKATLETSGKMIQPSLLDFLR